MPTLLSKSRKANAKSTSGDDSPSSSSDFEDYETMSDESSLTEEKKPMNKKKRTVAEDMETKESVKEPEKKNNEHLKKKVKQNLLILIGGAKETRKEKGKEKKKIVESDDDDDDYAEEDDDDDEDDDEDDDTEDSYEYYIDDLEEYDSETEKVFMKEVFDNQLETSQNKFYQKSVSQKPKTTSSSDEAEKNLVKEYKQLQDTKRMLLLELKKHPNNKICKTALESCNKDIQSIIVEQKKSNFKRFHDLLNTERQEVNENNYFIEKMSHQEQLQAIEKMNKYQKITNIPLPYRFAILESSISENLKSIVLQKINQMENMTTDQEYHKLKNWVDTFMKIPFGIYKNTLVQLEKDGIEASHTFMNRAQTILDECTYGLKEAKLQIMQMLGNWITNPSAVGTAIAIKGPPGTGKTSLVKDGVSKILGREFVFIPLGGAGDGSYLEGHSYTYEGSTWGKIVQSLMDCKSMNPVFYFDELDKVSESQRGQEIINILIHLTDTTQNNQFIDKYFTEINEFDLSKCLFIFSYNDESKVNPILLNRMHVIQTKGYKLEEKLIIGKNYLLPKIIQQINIRPEDIVLTDEIMKYILSQEQFCKKEDGVRNYKRALEIIFSKLNLYRIMKPDSLMFQQYPDLPKSIIFPHTVTKQDLEHFLKNNNSEATFHNMYI